MGLVRKAEFARMRGVSRAAVGAWDRRGLLVLDGGLVDVEASTAKLDARPEVYRGGRAKEIPNSPAAKPSAPAVSDEPSSWSTAEAIRRKETANALAKQLEYEVKASKLVDSDAVEARWRTALTDIRNRLLTVPGRCGTRISHLSRAEIATIDREVRDALQELGDNHAR
jgi:phage terminase Nu1 subunit (DNA packaging protein)